MTMLDVLENTERKLDHALVDQPRVEASIRVRLGRVYGEMRMPDAELRQYSRAYQLSKQHRRIGRPRHLGFRNRTWPAPWLNKGRIREAIDIYETKSANHAPRAPAGCRRHARVYEDAG